MSSPLDRIPLYVKAGSILPLGPDIEYAGERPDAPVEIRIYRGADGSFTLYEDSGDTYAYEKGMHSEIPIHWNELAGLLTIGTRAGTFEGMSRKRTFHVVFVTENHGAGPSATSAFDRAVNYEGETVTISAR